MSYYWVWRHQVIGCKCSRIGIIIHLKMREHSAAKSLLRREQKHEDSQPEDLLLQGARLCCRLLRSTTHTKHTAT